MTQEHKSYEVVRQDLGGIRSETLNDYNIGWEQPTPGEVRILIEYMGQLVGKNKLTGQEIADLVGVNSRNVRKWTAPETTSNFTRIPYAAWRLLLLHAGIVQLKSSMASSTDQKNCADHA